jgi:MFS family permease
MGVQLQCIGALGAPLLASGLVPDYAALGTLIGAYSLAGIVVALPSGWLLARFGDRRVLLAGLWLMALGGFGMALAPGFATALAARLLAGTGAALLSIAGAKVVLDRFRGPALVTAMGILLSAYPFGIALALLILPAFGDAWREALFLSAFLCLLAVPALWRAVAPAAPAADGSPPPRQAMRLRPGEWPPLLMVGLIWAAFNACYATVLGFTPAFLVAGGAGVEEAGAIVSVVGLAILPLLPFGGTIAERWGRPALACAICIAGMAGALLALAAGFPALPSLILFGLLAGPPASLVMALLGRVIAPESRAFGVGVHYTMFYLGMSGVPPVAGWLRDVTGWPEAPLLAAAAALGVALAALGALQAMRAGPARRPARGPSGG